MSNTTKRFMTFCFCLCILAMPNAAYDAQEEELISFLSSDFEVYHQALQHEKLREIYSSIATLCADKTAKEQQIIQCWIKSGFRAQQVPLANACGVTQSYVSRCIAKFKKQLKHKLEETL